MKKAVILVFSVLLLISVASCSDGNGNNSKVVKPAVPAEKNGDNDSSQDSADENTSPETKIDLAIVDAYFSPTYSNPGEDVELKFLVKNQGTEAAGSFDYTIKIYKGDSLWKEDTFTLGEGLAKEETTKVARPYVFQEAGTYSATVKVDSGSSISELVETNNEMEAKADAIVIK